MTLREKQSVFARMAARLILKAYDMGYEVTLGDAFRDPRAHGKQGVLGAIYGEAWSAHKNKLALDLNLFRNGQYLSSTASHRPLGEWWEQQGGTWGGRFKDGNHYSLEHQGVK